MNAAFEKPISACQSKFEGKIPKGEIVEKVKIETARMIQKYLRQMERAEYSKLLFAIENYARLINSMFTQYKPHDDRFPEIERCNALYSSFYVTEILVHSSFTFCLCLLKVPHPS